MLVIVSNVLMRNKLGPALQTNHLLYAYIILIAFASAAIPLGSIYVKFDWLGAILIIVLGTVLMLKGHYLNKVVLLYVVACVLWLVLNSLIALHEAQDHYNAYGFLSYFLQTILAIMVFLMISNMFLRTAIVYKLMKVWVMVGCAASILALIQVLVGEIIVDKFLYIPYYNEATISKKVVAGVLAPTAWFSEASWLGSFLVVPTIFMIYEVISNRKLLKAQIFNCVAALTLATGLFLTYSLTAILSVFIGIFAIIMLSPRSRIQILLLILLGIALILAFSDSERVVLQISRFVELFKNVTDFSPGSQLYGTTTSFYVRSVGIYEGLLLFLENPFSGIGIGQGERPFHSGFITLLAEQGIIGTTLYFVPLMLIIYRLNQVRRNGAREIRHLATFFIIALVADYSNGLVTHNSFQLQRWLLISVAFGWVYSLHRGRLYAAWSTNKAM